MPIVAVGFNRAAKLSDCPDTLQAQGPTIVTWVGFDPNYDGKNPQVPPVIPQDLKRALIDTGASHSSIDVNLAKQLNLPIIDKKPVSGVHGSMELEICTAQVHLPMFPFTIFGLFALVKLRDGGQAHDVLLGRHLLRHFTFYYDGVSGYTRMSR